MTERRAAGAAGQAMTGLAMTGLARLAVHSWGVAGSVRDAGIVGRAGWGAPRGGAADVWSLGLANRLVGNIATLAAFETSGGLDVEVLGAAVLAAVAGAEADITVTRGPAVAWGTPTVLPVGARLRILRCRRGARTIVAVRGGLLPGAHGDDADDVDDVDDLDDVLVAVGPDPGAAVSLMPAVPMPRPERLIVWPGPRLDWFDEAAWRTLCTSAFEVAPASNRVGVRLVGARFHRTVTEELVSEGMVEGAIQVPPSGHPIMMLADHPTTGGYPVIAVVDQSHLRHIAQLSPGDTVRFRAVAPWPRGGVDSDWRR